MKTGRMWYNSHTDTIYAGAQLRNMSGTGWIYEVGGFDEVLDKFQDVEVFMMKQVCSARDLG